MLIFAHRGASSVEPENTLRAIKRALQIGSDGIEVDIHQVEDNFVVTHNRWLQRTTSGTGQVNKSSIKQVRTFDAGKGERIPTLYTQATSKCSFQDA